MCWAGLEQPSLYLRGSLKESGVKSVRKWSGRQPVVKASEVLLIEGGESLSVRRNKASPRKRVWSRNLSASLCQRAPRRRPYGSLGSSAIIPGANLFLSACTGLFSLRSQRCRIRSFSARFAAKLADFGQRSEENILRLVKKRRESGFRRKPRRLEASSARRRGAAGRPDASLRYFRSFERKTSRSSTPRRSTRKSRVIWQPCR